MTPDQLRDRQEAELSLRHGCIGFAASLIEPLAPIVLQCRELGIDFDPITYAVVRIIKSCEDMDVDNWPDIVETIRLEGAFDELAAGVAAEVARIDAEPVCGCGDPGDCDGC